MINDFNIEARISELPDKDDIAFVATDEYGTQGQINLNGLIGLGYSKDDLPQKDSLKEGFYLLIQEGKSELIFIVTIAKNPTEENLRNNLIKAFEANSELIKGRSIWLPLMGTGSGGLEYIKSFDIIFSVIADIIGSTINPYKVTFALPKDIDPRDEKLIEFKLNTWKRGVEFDVNGLKDQVQNVRKESKLPKEALYYQDKNKKVAEAKDFIFEYIISSFEALKTYESQNRSAKNSIYSSLQYWFDQLKPDDTDEVYDILKEKEPELVSVYDFIKQFADDIEYLNSHKNDHSSIKSIKTASSQLKLIKQIVEYASYNFKFGFLEEQNSLLQQAINYLYNPTVLFNIFSETHQRDISSYFIGEELVGSEFHQSLKEHFSKYGFEVFLRENETCFYTAVIYDDEVRKLWEKDENASQEGLVNEKTSISAKITTAFNDSANQRTDLIGVNREIEVFARLLAQKDLSPPLAIALFGNWGSGKSFFMHNLEANIKQLSALDIKKPDGTPFYCKEIVHISFNAWSYLDANLWAGLVTSIFEKLSEYLTESTKSGVARMKVLETLRERLKSFQSLKQSEEEKNVEYEILKRGYEFEQENLEKSIKSNFSKNIIQIINGEKQLNDIYSGISKDRYLSELTEQLKFDELQQEAQLFKSFWRNLKKSRSLIKYVLPAVIGVAIAIAIWGASQYFKLSLGALIPFIGSLGFDWGKLLYRYNQVKKFVIKFNNIVEQNVDLEEKVDEHKELVKNADDQIKEAQDQITQLDKKIRDYEKYMETEINQETIKDFIQKRAQHSDYKGKLGIVSIIRRDFETLSELFSESNKQDNNSRVSEEEKKLLRGQFKQGRSLERIILYIDDLDRCSDDKVLEVLQAVHLLMAFPLFIVVVGVDKRCVTNALYNREVSKYFQLEEYSKIKKREKTNGIHIIHPDEYLEKIFQIPFQLQKPEQESI
jgi:hypothetical protein